MAFDYGRKRIGVAVGQTVSRTAKALKVLPATHGNTQWHQINGIVDEWAPVVFVVGMPTHDDQRVHTLHGEIERFSRRLSGRYNLPVEFIDERLSSYAAGRDGPGERATIDAEAARMILLTWLEQTHTPLAPADR